MTSGIAVQFFDVAVDSVVRMGEARFKVTHVLSADTVLAVDLDSGEAHRLPIEQLVVERDPVPARDADRPRDLSLYSADEWQQAQDRLQAIKGLIDDSTRTRKAAEAAAEAAGVHVSTLYRWLNDYLRVGNVSVLVPTRRGRKAGTRLLSAGVEAIIDKVIEEFYLDKQRHTPQDVIDEVDARCRLNKVAPPHPNTIRARIRRVPEVVQLRRRGRREEATNRFTPIKGSIENATHPFAVIMIDHTPMDVIVVDEVNRQPIARPYLSIGLDVFSRMVAGLYISLDPPSSASVALCLANVICPKREYLAMLGVPGSWPVWGKPAMVHVDNAKEFRGLALERGAAQHGIDLQWRPPETPNYGGHIERFIGTAMRFVHKLPGTTFSNPKQRKGYDSDAESALTLKELEIELVDFIVNKYHQSVHAGIGVSPLKKWERGIIGSDDAPGLGLMPMPSDPHRILIDFLPMSTRSVQRYGIQWDNITYYDPVLDTYINSSDSEDAGRKRRFIVRRDPRDISCIYFYNPEDNSYTRLPYRNIGYPPMSLFELNFIRKQLTDEGIRDIDEVLIFERLERSRERVAAAVQNSKQARKAQARMHASSKPRVSRGPKSASNGPSQSTVLSQASNAGKSSTEFAGLNQEGLVTSSGIDDDIFAEPVRPFDNLGLRR